MTRNLRSRTVDLVVPEDVAMEVEIQHLTEGEPENDEGQQRYDKLHQEKEVLEKKYETACAKLVAMDQCFDELDNYISNLKNKHEVMTNKYSDLYERFTEPTCSCGPRFIQLKKDMRRLFDEYSRGDDQPAASKAPAKPESEKGGSRSLRMGLKAEANKRIVELPETQSDFLKRQKVEELIEDYRVNAELLEGNVVAQCKYMGDEDSHVLLHETVPTVFVDKNDLDTFKDDYGNLSIPLQFRELAKIVLDPKVVKYISVSGDHSKLSYNVAALSVDIKTAMTNYLQKELLPHQGLLKKFFSGTRSNLAKLLSDGDGANAGQNPVFVGEEEEIEQDE